MNRYLLNISYIGTRFQGVTKTQAKHNADPEYTTIEGNIQSALEKLKPVNPVKLQVSSRTDSGVHALHSTMHVDLQRIGHPYHPSLITHKLNKLFSRWGAELNVINTELVPNTFHAQRSATNRTYLYRLAVAKEPLDKTQSLSVAQGTQFIPIEEINRCHFILNNNFDINRAKEISQLFVGIHDFRTFMSTSKEQKTFHPLFAVRRLKSIDIRPGSSIVTPMNEENTYSKYDFWDIEFNSRSYVYRQIRRIVGTIIAAGEGKVTKRDVYEMLTIPSKHSWDGSVKIAPAYGLYLARVAYDENSKVFPCENDSDDIQQQEGPAQALI